MIERSSKFLINHDVNTELFTYHGVIQESADCNEEIGMHVSMCSLRYSLDDSCVSVLCICEIFLSL